MNAKLSLIIILLTSFCSVQLFAGQHDATFSSDIIFADTADSKKTFSQPFDGENGLSAPASDFRILHPGSSLQAGLIPPRYTLPPYEYYSIRAPPA